MNTWKNIDQLGSNDDDHVEVYVHGYIIKTTSITTHTQLKAHCAGLYLMSLQSSPNCWLSGVAMQWCDSRCKCTNALEHVLPQYVFSMR